MCVQVACLGVPDAQWAALGHAALEALHLEVASKAFGRIKETGYLRLLHQLDQARKAGQPPAILKADVLAHQVLSVPRLPMPSFHIIACLLGINQGPCNAAVLGAELPKSV